MLLEVRDGFASLGLRYDAVLASLELALVYLEEKRVADSLWMVEECLPVLHALEVEREEFMALTILAKAVEEGTVTVELLSQAVEHLRRQRG